MKVFATSSFTFLIFSGALMAADNGGDAGVFADIANQVVRLRSPGGMEIPVRGPLPDKNLAWTGGAPAATMPRIDTPEKLAAALSDLRERHAPFLKSYLPAETSLRLRAPVREMYFRAETAEDIADFGHTLAGGGRWEKVAIPHYTGPVEKASAWYRTTLVVTPEMKARPRLYACFSGVEYFAEVYLNGHYIGGHEGYFAPFDLEFTKYAKIGENTLLVKVSNSSRMGIGSSVTAETPNRKNNVPRTFGDKIQSSNSPGWDEPHFGWNCTPNGYGISQKLVVEARSDIFIGDIRVTPDVAKKTAEVTVELENPSEQNGSAVLRLSVLGDNFEAVAARDIVKKCSVSGTRGLYRFRVPIPEARLWSPDTPWLYGALVTLEDGAGKMTDTARRSFGMRSFTLDDKSVPAGRMYLNGKEIRLRGANEMGNFQLDVLRGDTKQLIDDILLAKLTNMNFLRTTQTVMAPEFYDMCDRLGFMNQSDLPLFSKVSHKQYTECLKQTVEMARVVRTHPSNIMVSFMNEPDPGDGTGGKAFSLNRGELELLMNQARELVHLTDPGKAVKLVDGDYNPPSDGYPDNHCYSGWYGDHGVSQAKLYAGTWMSVRKGRMFGCGEFGAEGLDPVNTMRDLYPEAWMYKDDATWKPDRIEGSQTWKMFRAWYPEPKGIQAWVEASQRHQADVVKLHAEAYRRMPRMNSFAVHLFIDAWPNGWLKSIMDVRRQPKKAWYAYRDALAPIAVQVVVPGRKDTFAPGSATEAEIWVCNDLNTKTDLKLSYELIVGDKTVSTGATPALMPTVTDGAIFQGRLKVGIPKDAAPGAMRIRATLTDAAGAIVDQYDYAGRIVAGTK